MPKSLTSSLIAGLLAAGVFLAVAVLGLGFFFIFLATIPLFYAGLGQQAKHALLGSLLATALLSLVTTLSVGAVFLFFLGLPAWYLSNQAVRWRLTPEGQREWFPVGLIIVHLSIWASAFIALITLYYAMQPESITELLSKEIYATFADLKDEYGEVIDLLANRWSFFIFSMTTWLWGIALFIHAWLAHRLLLRKGQPIRPEFNVVPFRMPHWMLSLLAISGLASLIGSPSLEFLGNAVLLALLLPYFFLGAAIMHESSKHWPSRKFFLFFIYFCVLAQFWPALVLAGMGLVNHIKTLNKDLSSGGTSTRS